MSTGMDMMPGSLVAALEDMHARIAAATLSLATEALAWRPTPDAASVRALVLQAAGAERHWIGEVVAEMPPASAEPSPALADPHPLFELGSASQFSQVVLSNLTPAQWVALRQVDGTSLSVADCVLKLLEELARLLGQIELTGMLWRAQTGVSRERS
jgi:hypothetical protein